MKKRTWILSMILTLIFAFSSNGYSQLLSVSINPFVDPSYTLSSPGGPFNALVTVTNNSSNPTSYQFFQLQGGSVLTFNSISSISSNTWSPYNFFPNTGSTTLNFLGGLSTALEGGQSFSFVMTYTFNPGITALTANWGSGGVGSLWSMNGLVVEDINNFINTEKYGFSTTITPEPGTLILLGFGLLGSGFFARRRKKRDS